MNLLIFALLGLVIGMVAKFLMPGRDPGGIIVTSLLGIGGSMLAAWLGRKTGIFVVGANGPSFLASTLGAMALLVGYRLLFGRSK